uniref:Uncharacterized protein n=1 Tax=Nelumbo nucifera TaxID=4432 RepID=A0A822YYB7_NELNU|nr:TPA_asm: hypothetical protein HUJ06_008178 [Nelumbo nucifera]
MSTWFVFDVCSTAPLQPLSLLFTDNSNELGFKVLSMLRLWRLQRVSSLFERSMAKSKSLSLEISNALGGRTIIFIKLVYFLPDWRRTFVLIIFGLGAQSSSW